MIDQTDKEILTLLEEKSRMKVKEIAEQVHLSAPTVSQRLIKLEEDGVIKKIYASDRLVENRLSYSYLYFYNHDFTKSHSILGLYRRK